MPASSVSTGCRGLTPSAFVEPTLVRTCIISSHSRLPGLLRIRLPTAAGLQYEARRPTAQSSYVAPITKRPSTRPHPREGRGLGNV
ncbi:hypothetical protein STRTUCAR8_02790 [Streptomyces turgidiscabies Car8]|uniref:Uncharacterized protein n=1 Tax=Streptomyces turgidiscabies (strain Car8) TaxID=698760 RepID=L7FH43_STRT8|nr:hypothetical protein STRTUCAR8_02790 [Streptomyces turgidiscabies Car8]